MIAYQVQFNGKAVALAGLNQGVVSAIANWVFVPSDLAIDPATDWRASFSLGGLDNATNKHLHWFRTDLRIGDEITLKLVQVEEVDAPKEPLFSKSPEEIKQILNEEFERSRNAEQDDGTKSA